MKPKFIHIYFIYLFIYAGHPLEILFHMLLVADVQFSLRLYMSVILD